MAAYDDYNDNEYESYSEEDEIPIPAIRRFDSNIPLILNGVDCMEEIMENFEFVFEQRYGETRPVFHRGSLAEASRAAFKAPSLQKRPLALYLHKEETDQDQCFPFRVMTNKAVVTLLRKNFVLWGWDVTSQKNKEKLERLMAEADMRRIYREIEQMDPTKFPMLIIIEAPCWVHEIVEKIQVSDSADEVRAVLLKRLNIAVEAKNMENFNFLRDALRDEQREEYEKTLALDKAKMEERLKQELAEKEKKEKEAEEKAAKERREKEKQVLAEEKQAELPEEPKTTDPDTVTVRVRLPGGKAENRTFRFTEEVRLLLTYVESLGFSMTSHNVFNSDRPKKNVADFDLEKTFAEVKWPKREMVFVEEKF
ncbi:hypothetical protein L596_009696 [Steinernema carpocapsae]|uniref:UBX domain-containing protein n=1 Tax=Steinernema carpocapsae TaxID=34508 RepID=A0A4U5PG43_STECR|nr:hypothetical protein L596_009696 [Steinernema carpocapsae]